MNGRKVITLVVKFFIMPNYAELLTPVNIQVWNLSLSTHTWPDSWKRANINLLQSSTSAKRILTNGASPSRPWSQEHSKKLRTTPKTVVENSFSPSQFAHRQGVNCTNVLLSIQHHVYRHLGKSDCKAVRLFTTDFSKAFDYIHHKKLSAKLKQLPLNRTSLIGTIASWLRGNSEFSIIITSVTWRSLTREPPKEA